ncbi:ferredoxin [Sulfurifustis variabilis]|uniref:Ferredoxin n=1 Tax=Sulfurifustis variabilis TaxID=1675686 RepID=A0A1B4V710_9GAMM|nr:RnfABCDGE type electron transport complex subunit B [Sulfurifustis variabilis]BAU49308.1 ferredoxin [Sulfurifustis variabilis]
MAPEDLVGRIDACLPQTQCTRCGYPRCRAYAEAVARGEADLNRCPPGGDYTLHSLARLLGVPPKPLDPGVGAPRPRVRAAVDEARCIGCRKCLDVCPVDAIVGSRRQMHTVIAPLCTGCELCVPPCPVDCILLVPAPPAAAAPWNEYARAEADEWRERTGSRLLRLGARRERVRRRSAEPTLADIPPPEQIRRDLEAALERSRQRRASARPRGTAPE